MTDFTDVNVSNQLKLECTAKNLSNLQMWQALQVQGGGSGYTSSPSVSISGGGGTGATATASIAGPITGVAVTNGGSGYTSSPTVSFSGVGDAQADAIVNGGQVTAIRVKSGGSYTSPPSVSFVGGGGSGATAQATMSVTSISLTNAGSGYTSDPIVTIADPTGPVSFRLTATAYAKINNGDHNVESVHLSGDMNSPKGLSYLRVKDSSTTNFSDIYLVTSSDNYNAPILTLTQGMMLEKDLMVGGFIDSGQGALWLNYGLKGRPILSTPPLIQLISSDVHYPSGDALPPDPEKGQLFNHNETKKMWNGNEWITGNFTGKYDTLFLLQNDLTSPVTWAHLDLGSLTAHSDVNVTGNTTISGVLNVLAGGGSCVLRQNTASSYAGLRIYNDQNSAYRALEIDYSGSSYSGSLLSGGPTGESAAITTTGNYPLVFGTNNTSRIIIDTNGMIGANSANGIGLNGWNIVFDIENASHGAFRNQASGVFFGLHSNGNCYWGNSAAYLAVLDGYGTFTAFGDMVTNHLRMISNQNAYLGYWSSGTNGLMTSGDFYVNGDGTIAGQWQFNNGSTAAYLVWSNTHVLTLGSESSSPFSYVVGGVTKYFGALDCGAVFCQDVEPIGDVSYVNICGNIRVDSSHLYSYYGGGIGGASGGVYWDRYGNFIFNGANSGNSWNISQSSGGTNLFSLSYGGTLTLAGNMYIGGRYLYSDGSYLRSSSGFVCDSTLNVSNLTGGSNHAVYATSGGQLTNTASSLRFKQNIETLTECSWLYDLRPVSFDWKDEEQAKADGPQIGFIAEEVYAISPQLAWLNTKGQPEGVHYEKLGVPLVVEIQKLKQRIEALENQLTKNHAAA
jgi:hypothetical protein